VNRLLAALALACALAGAAVLVWADKGLTTVDTTVEGVPLTVVRSGTPKAGAVVAHGFGGSARLMAGFADMLARHGFAVVLLDFAGHGRNTRRWHDTGALSADLDVAVAHLRSLPGVDPARTVLVGHSMGAAAVTSYAANHPDIAATVAVSLGVKPDVLPHKLLLIVGGLEFRGFKEAAAGSAQGADPGDRRMVVVPGVEHVSVLFAPRTHSEMLRWFGAAPGPEPFPARRVLGGALLLLGFAFGLHPLAGVLFAPRATPIATPPPWWPALAVAACVVALPAAWLLPDPLPIAVTGYVTIFAAVAGVLMLVAASRAKWPAVWHRRRASLVLIVYAGAAVTVPLQLGLTNMIPAGPRWWLLPIVVASFTAFAWGNLRLTGARFAGQLAGCAAAVVVLTIAAITGLAPGFLVLVVPLLALLLAWQAVWIAVLRRFAVAPAVMALTGAILPALPALAAMPLI
jgi:pimeloyl-ACP methyl ester carboxylesterase